MFMSSPNGNASARAFDKRMRNEGWIAIMLVESKNNSPKWLPNFLAAHDDAVKRFRIQEGMKFATGFSGGARVASFQVGARPGFAGLILQAAGFYHNGGNGGFKSIIENPEIVVTFIAGNQDGNRGEKTSMLRNISPHADFKAYSFEGGHDRAPEAVLNEAIDWMLGCMLDKKLTPEVFSILVPMEMSLKSEPEHPYLRWEKIDRIEKSAEAFPDSNEKISSIVSTLTTEKQKLESSLDLSDEIAAKDSFLKIQEDEQELMADFAEEPDMKASKKNRKLQRIIDSYRKAGEYNPKTAYGLQSIAAAKRLETQLTDDS